MFRRERIVFLLNSGINKSRSVLFFSGLSLILASLLVLFYPIILLFLLCGAGLTAGAVLILLSMKFGQRNHEYDNAYYRYF